MVGWEGPVLGLGRMERRELIMFIWREAIVLVGKWRVILKLEHWCFGCFGCCYLACLLFSHIYQVYSFLPPAVHEVLFIPLHFQSLLNMIYFLLDFRCYHVEGLQMVYLPHLLSKPSPSSFCMARCQCFILLWGSVHVPPVLHRHVFILPPPPMSSNIRVSF
jgi:hypothetical protein